MTWMNPNPQIHNTFASLATRNGDNLCVHSDCLDVLEEIYQQLNIEDCKLRTFRRAIGFSQNIQNDLIPLLIHVKDNKNIVNGAKIVDCIIKLLVNLTIPIEYLLPLEMMNGSDVEKHSIFELSNLLSSSKEIFSDGKSTKAVMDHMKEIIDGDTSFTLDQCESINNCLVLLRNILHIPEVNLSSHSLQNQIVWNLFIQSIDKIIIFLISCPQKLFWSVNMVQLIALLYKDQHVGTLQKLLNLWMETSVTESSEDNESNTSAPSKGRCNSSPFLTSDPTSDSSDGNDVAKVNENVMETRITQTRSKLCDIKRVQSTETEASSSSGIGSMMSFSSANKSQITSPNEPTFQQRECPSSTSEISDCGYGTQVENQELVSTSSNDDDQPSQKPVHQKPHTFQKTRYNIGKKATTPLEKKELRRKKLVKRSKTNTIRMKGLMHHLPIDEDITNVLKEFTVDFLLKGYGNLVHDLHTQLLSNVYLHIDTSHFFWLVTYFLKFATQLELDPEHLSQVLTYDLLSYLIFQGVCSLEELEMKSKVSYMDLKPSLRRLHLVVTAIREFLQALESYQKMIHLSGEDRNNLQKLQFQVAETEELGSLFLLLLRHYNSKLQSRQYLQDVILTNHNYLLFLDNVSKIKNSQKFNLMDHLKKFAAVEIICQYGILLENFRENGEFVNNCLFTMMHHIGGDLNNVSILFQPNILKTFSRIWETDFQLCDDWSDLIEYVIHKFINTPRSPRYPSDKRMECCEDNELVKDSNEYTKDQNCKNTNAMSEITEKYNNFRLNNRTQISIIREMLLENDGNDQDFLKNTVEENVKYKKDFNTVQTLKECLSTESRAKQVLWLQEVLLEFCYAKIILENSHNLSLIPKVEPTIYYHSLLNLPIPLIPWTTDQNNSLKFPPFIHLLHELGFYLPVNTGKIFVRIPNFWTADFIYSKAQQLGPIDINKLKFGVDVLGGNKINNPCVTKYIENSNVHEAKFFYDSKETPSLFRYTPLPNSTEWTQSVIFSDLSTHGSRTNELSIDIPEEILPCNLSVPELLLVPLSAPRSSHRPLSMDCSNTNEEIERMNICDTASDLTRMCVSDEEEKTAIQKNS